MTPSRRRPKPCVQPRGRRRLAVLILIAALAPAAPSLAAAPAVPVLATGTSITWTGAAGTLLSVPTTTTLPDYGARLTVRGGTYAVVRMSPRADCRPAPRCPVEFFLDYTRALAARHGSRGPDYATYARIGNGVLRPAVWETYLLTDGTATLTFDRTDAPGRGRAHRARGRVNAALVPLPVTCSGPACGPQGQAGRFRYGGVTLDAGPLGNVDYLVASWSSKPSVPQAVTGVRGCLSTTEPDPAAHPLGCDTATTDPSGASYAALGTAELVAYSAGTTAAVRTDAARYARGPTYVGHQVVTAHDASAPVTEAYAVRLTYGIR